MLESLGNAFYNNELTGEETLPLNTEAGKMIEIHDDIISKYPCGEYYEQLLAASMEKAQTYRMANRRDLALQTFDDILTWVGSVDYDYVQRWRCITNAELMVKQAIIEPDKFEDAIALCGNIIKRSSVSAVAEENKLTKAPNESLIIQPNPASDKTMLNYSLTENSVNAYITVSNTFGQQIFKTELNSKEKTLALDCSNYMNGVYVITLYNNQKIVAVKKLVISK